MVVGVDLGGTKIAASVVDAEGRILHRVKRPASKDVAELAEAAEEAVRAARMEWGAIEGVGLAIPGIYFADSGRAWAPNVWGMDEIELRGQLAPLVPTPLAIDSDRTAYVLGEQWMGAARGAGDVVYLAVGTGIGAGILAGGRVIRGKCGIAGAVGWFTLDPREGSFEALAAGPAVARRAGKESAEQVVEAARGGDPAARAVLNETADWLARGIANLISTFNPELVVLGGGLMQAGDLMIGRIREQTPRWAQPLAARRTRIELTQLGEDAGLLGAARLALSKRLHSD